MLPKSIDGLQFSQAGDFDRKVTLLAPSTQRDENGEAMPDVVVAEVWASIAALLPKYIEKTQQTVTEVTYKIKIRYRAGITTANRVSFRGRLYNIEGVVNLGEANRELHLFCYQRN